MSSNKMKKEPVATELSTQLASFSEGVEALYSKLRQEQLHHEFLKRQALAIESENRDLRLKMQDLQKSLKNQYWISQQLADAREKERIHREKQDRNLRAVQETSARRIDELTRTLEMERERHRAELGKQRELMLLEIRMYREEMDQILGELEQVRSSSKARTECESCNDLNAQHALQYDRTQRALQSAKDELDERNREFSAAELRASNAERELNRLRNQLQKMDRLAEIRSLISTEQDRSKTSESRLKLGAFHPNRLKIDQELAELGGGNA